MTRREFVAGLAVRRRCHSRRAQQAAMPVIGYWRSYRIDIRRVGVTVREGAALVWSHLFPVVDDTDWQLQTTI